MTLRALGPGGLGPAKTLVIPPASPATPLGQKVALKLGRAGSVVGLGSRAVFGTLKRISGKCDSQLHTQADGLDIRGCMQPLTSLQEIPDAEWGVLQEQAKALGIPLTRDAAQTALSLSNAWIAYQGVSVNGVQMNPSAGSAIVILPQIHIIAASNAALSIGQLKFSAPPRFTFDTRLVGGQIDIGSFGLAAGSLDALGAFKILGKLDVKLVPPGSGPDSPGARITATLRAPSFLSVAGVNLQGQVVAARHDGPGPDPRQDADRADQRGARSPVRQGLSHRLQRCDERVGRSGRGVRARRWLPQHDPQRRRSGDQER